MILGRKEYFAIEINSEFESQSNLLRPIKIWIDGISLGTFEDTTYIPTFIARLTRCLELEIALPESMNDTTEINLFNHFNLSNDSGKYLLGLDSSFDDYQIYFFHKDKKIYFLWKLCDYPFFQYNEYNQYYKDKVFLFGIEKQFLSTIINDFKQVLSKL